MTSAAGQTLARIEAVFQQRGAESYLGEDVTMAEHMLQCADLARAAGAGDELVLAALLHDIGHYTGDFPEEAFEQGIDNHHDRAGAAVVQAVFPPLVADCIRLHVDAKRYLCAVEPAYHDALSPASQHSLAVQGGPMNDREVAAFEAEPAYREAIRLRRWDDAGKVPGQPTSRFDDYRDLLQKLSTYAAE